MFYEIPVCLMCLSLGLCVSCAFSLAVFLLFVCFVLFQFVILLSYSILLLRLRSLVFIYNKKGLDLDGMRAGEDLKGVGGVKKS